MTMQSSDIYALRPADDTATDWQISSAETIEGTWLEGLAGMESVAVQVRFAWGSGSGGVKAILQSSLDEGNTAYDVALASFDQDTRTVMFVVKPVTTGVLEPGEGGVDANGSNEAEGVLASVLGDRLRLKVIIAGTYQNTTIAARVMPA